MKRTVAHFEQGCLGVGAGGPSQGVSEVDAYLSPHPTGVLMHLGPWEKSHHNTDPTLSPQLNIPLIYKDIKQNMLTFTNHGGGGAAPQVTHVQAWSRGLPMSTQSSVTALEQCLCAP